MPSAQAEPVELDLLRAWREPLTSRRVFRDALGSLVVHGVLIIAFILAPEVELSRNAPVIADDLKRSVKLTLPPRYFEPTQKAPNLGKVKRELDDRSSVEGAHAQPRRYRPPSLSAGLPQPAAPSIVAEAPNLDLSHIEGPKTLPASLPTPNLPLQPPAPQASADNPTKRGIPPPPKSAGISVGDAGIDQPSITGSNQTPVPCQTCSTLQLLSNPQDVDFQPYLLQVLRVVKQNWLTVIPAEARQGRRGNVTVRFVIDKKGAITNLVITGPSGTGAFDLAAATGLSMSNSHFPSLPSGYKGDEIRLQMTFAYNSQR